jgi:hypothetical protein
MKTLKRRNRGGGGMNLWGTRSLRNSLAKSFSWPWSRKKDMNSNPVKTDSTEFVSERNPTTMERIHVSQPNEATLRTNVRFLAKHSFDPVVWLPKLNVVRKVALSIEQRDGLHYDDAKKLHSSFDPRLNTRLQVDKVSSVLEQLSAKSVSDDPIPNVFKVLYDFFREYSSPCKDDYECALSIANLIDENKEAFCNDESKFIDSKLQSKVENWFWGLTNTPSDLFEAVFGVKEETSPMSVLIREIAKYRRDKLVDEGVLNKVVVDETNNVFAERRIEKRGGRKKKSRRRR